MDRAEVSSEGQRDLRFEQFVVPELAVSLHVARTMTMVATMNVSLATSPAMAPRARNPPAGSIPGIRDFRCSCTSLRPDAAIFPPTVMILNWLR
ncbi:MAG: hypothetical protein ACRDWV_03640 [Acidimicrobiales bacterium]